MERCWIGCRADLRKMQIRAPATVMAKAVRVRKKRVYKPVAKENRRNLKLWAQGARETILKAHIPAYMDALERGWRAERDYLMEVCHEYHSTISWRLDDHEEPTMPLAVYDKFALPEKEVLSEEETVAKRKRVEVLNAVCLIAVP